MFGYHVAKGDGFATSIPAAVAQIRSCGIERSCVQIYASGPRTAHAIIAPGDYAAIAAAINGESSNHHAAAINGESSNHHAAASRETSLVIHGAYIDNPWGEYKKQKGPRISTKNIIAELEIGHAIGARGVIVHLAAGAAEEESIDYVLQTIDSDTPDEVLETQVLFLEINTAKASPATFETPEKIAALFRQIEATRQSFMLKLRVGLCIDSAHVFSCGVSFADYAFTRDWLERVKQALGADTPIMFHLNDSGSTLGSGKDVHEELCKGSIWSSYAQLLPLRSSGIAAIVEFVSDNDLMCIREHKTQFPKTDLQLVSSLL